MSAAGLRFLADEGCDFAVVRALRAAGFDVLAVAELMNRSVDSELMQRAHREQRILLTEDKDFGWLVFVAQVDSAGVILIRYPGNARQGLVAAVRELVQSYAAQLSGAFVILQPGQIRFSRRPPLATS
jgi:predicted nuclease of predicted toxin-antitoxin system